MSISSRGIGVVVALLIGLAALTAVVSPSRAAEPDSTIVEGELSVLDRGVMVRTRAAASAQSVYRFGATSSGIIHTAPDRILPDGLVALPGHPANVPVVLVAPDGTVSNAIAPAIQAIAPTTVSRGVAPASDPSDHSAPDTDRTSLDDLVSADLPADEPAEEGPTYVFAPSSGWRTGGPWIRFPGPECPNWWRCPNSAPTAGDDAFSTDEDTPFTTGDVLDNDSDFEGDSLAVAAFDAVSTQGGTVTYNNDGTFDYTPLADFNGVDSFTYDVTDGSLEDSATVTITVDPINDDPVAVDDHETTDEDTPFTTGDVLDNDSDVDGDTLTVSSFDATSVEGGTVSHNGDGTFDYSPPADFEGSDQFGYSVSDGNGGSASANVHISVGGVNDDPVANDDGYATDEDTVLVVPAGDLQSNDTDTEDGTPSGDVTLGTDVSDGTLVLNLDGSFTYTPDADFNGSDSFTYTVDDSVGATSNTATVTITVNAVNDDPVATDDAYSVDEDASLTGENVLDNDTDVEDTTPGGTVTLGTDVSDGSLTLNSDGTFTYDPDPDFNGTDSFTYTVTDSDGATSNEATVTITVDPVNDAPVAGDSSESTDEDSTVDGSFNVSDSDGDDPAGMTYDITQPTDGLVTDNGDGTFTFDPDGDFDYLEAGESVDVMFTYSVTDQGGLPSAADGTITVTVNGINDSDALIATKSVEAHEILYRVNAGGSEVAANDGGPAWTADSPASPSPWINAGYTAHKSSTKNTGGALDLSGVPSEAQIEDLFTVERWDEPAVPEMGYSFPVLAGTEVEVRLYFAETYNGIDAAGERLFDVTIDGAPFLTNYDLWAESGNTNNIGLMESTTITSDGEVNIDFAHDTENPAIKAIEIVGVGDALPEPGGTFVYTATAENPAANGEDIQIDSVTDSVYGDVSAFCDSSIPAVLAPGATLECVFEADHSAVGDYTNTVTYQAIGYDSSEDASATSNEATATVVEVPGIPAATITVNDGEGIGASTFTAGSFEIDNTSVDLDIVGVSLDISSALISDAVFDPNGTAGDALGKCLTPDGGSGAVTGFAAPVDPCVDPFADPYNGVDGDDGWYTVSMAFGDFNPGETFEFSVDIDPVQIKNATGTGGAGSVSGLDLAGAEVVIEFSDGTILTNNLFRQGTTAGGAISYLADPVLPSVTIDSVAGVTLGNAEPGRQWATVVDAAQVVTVTGPANQDVTLLVAEAEMPVAATNDVDESDAADLIALGTITEYSATIDGSGTVDIPITLTRTDAEGGYNLITAVADDGTVTGPTSNHVVLILEETWMASGLTGGASVSTDVESDGAFEHDPIEATVTVPSTGTYDVEIHEVPTTTTSGYTLLGQEVDITISGAAPGPTDPFAFEFRVDSTFVSGTTDILKDGVLVPACNAPGSGEADPDPCVYLNTTAGDGDALLGIYSTTASTWSFASDIPANVPPSFDQDLGDRTDIEGDSITLASPATDSDGFPSPLFYSATGLPSGLSINDATGEITGTIDLGAASGSPYAVTVTVTDGADSVDDTFTWTVDAAPVTPAALYRINVGGPEYPAADASLPVWSADTAGSPSSYRTEGGTDLYDSTSGSAYTVVTTDPSIPASAPDEIFHTERYDVATAPEMLWEFPVTGGNTYEVRLFFAELYNGIDAAGERVFDVTVDGVVPAAFDDIDQFATAGAGGGFMVSATVVADDASLDLQFIHDVENPALKGIEILAVDGLAATPASHDFGMVDVGSTGSQTFTITNVGSVSIETTSITIIGDGAFSLASIPPYPNNIAPGEDYTIDVDFDPTSDGLVAAYVEIVNTEDTLNIALIGEGVEPPPTVLYRVNAGGPEVGAIDGNGPWESDTGGSSAYRSGGATTTAGGNTSNTWAPAPFTPAASTPNAVFGTEAWGDMQWNFAVTPGTQVEVRVYLQESYDQITGANQRVFNVNIDGGTVEFPDVDLYGTHGYLTAVMYATTITADADGVDIDFSPGAIQNPQVNAIELVTSQPQPGILGVSPLAHDFGDVLFGSSESTTVTVTNLGDTGDPTITIGAGDVSLDNGEFSHDFAGPVVLNPGDSHNFDVMFNPADAGAESATLTVVHDGNNSPTTATFDGDGTSSIPPGFSSSDLTGYASNNPTSLQFGPDSRLYVSDRYGTIRAYTIVRNGQDDYEATAVEVINDIQGIVNHHDHDGSVDGGKNNRQVTGLLVAGTPSNPVLYVTSSDPQVVTNGDSGLDTNSGTLSRLTWNGSSWDHVQLVRGLPRSEENHATNGMALDQSDNTLYIIQGGHTNMGAPNSDFSGTPEYALSGALLSVDLDAIEAMPTQQDGSGQDYKYNIPTIDDPTRPNTGNTYNINGQVVNEDVGDPFGGNDGLNQAAWILGGPVEVYSPGYRNAYDVVLTQAGRLYTFDNGPNGGWGGLPVGEGPGGTCTNEFNESGSAGLGDGLYYITGPGYYGGHPNPTRANPDDADLFFYSSSSPWTELAVYDFGTDLAYPVDPSVANPVECDYINPNGYALAVINSSTNGLAEYTATNFGGAMTGDLIAVAHNGTAYQFALNAAGDTVTTQSNFASPGSTPLDVTTQGDSEIFPGTVWIAQFGGGIKVYEPTDYDGSGSHCVGGPGAIDEDGDGFTNDDEIDNGTNECSAADYPSDFDGDDISDLNDPDDDNDGTLDEDDPFAIDPDDGATTPLPASCGADSTPSTDTCLHFLSGDRSGTILDLGFTGLMTNGSTNWLDQYDEEKLIVGGVIEALGLEDVPPGDAHATTNSQLNGFQFGFDPGSTPFVLHTRVLNPLSDTPDNYMSAGLQFGPGDQDNYVKFVVGALTSGAGGGGLQLATEVGGSFTGTPTTSDPNVEGQKAIDLWLTIDPATGDVDATYAIDDGPVLSGGSTSVPTGWFSSPVGVGLISTSNGASPFDVTWALLEAWQPVSVSGTPEAQIDIDGGSTFGNNTMDITNTSTGTVQIESVTFDLSSTILQNVVFDPTDGTPAGDTAGKCLDINTEGGTGFDGSGDLCVDPFSSPHQNGYYVMDMDFTDFDPGETVEFSVDIDPTSIAGLTGSSDPGSIGGFELTGATVTVSFSNGSTFTGTLIGDGAGDDSHATVRSGLPGAPTSITAVGVAPIPTILGTANHTIRVEGPEGAEVLLFEVEGELLWSDPASFPFEANKALHPYSTQTGTISGGQVDFSVTLDDSSAEGGLNYFMAVLTDGSGGPAGDAPSDRLILEYDDGSTGTVVHRVNAGGGALVDPPFDWQADGEGAANHAALTDPGSDDTGSFDGAHGVTVPAGTPLEIWDTERYSVPAGGSMEWDFSVATGNDYLLRLYVNNGWSGTSTAGTRLFDITVEGDLIVEDLDLAATFGHQIGGVVTVRVNAADVADGTLSFVLSHGAEENPLINAIEIIQL